MKIIKTIQRKLSPTLVFVTIAMAVGVFTLSAAGAGRAFATPIDGAYSGQVAVNTQPQRDDEVDPNYGQQSGDTTGPVKTSILPSDLDAIGLIKMAIWIMSAGIGVVAVGGIVWGAILYTSAGSSDRAKKGIEVIRNVVLGLLLYIFMLAIINFLIPGGLIT